MSEGAYRRSGVNEAAAGRALSALRRSLTSIDPGRPSRQLPLAGHYASVITINEDTAIALSTDGVGTKLLVAEELGRYDTVGIDCVAMNVNDVVCVGAEPLAMLDYIAAERADEAICEQIGVGLARGAELAGIEIPGGELAQLGEMVRGFDLAGACFGVVDPARIIDGSSIEPGDAVIGLPSSGLHSNGYTLARRALEGIPLSDERLGEPLSEVLLRPTEIYVRAVLELLRSPLAMRGLAHITSGGLSNLLRLSARVAFEIDDPLPVPEIFSLISERAGVEDDEMHEVFNMGCGFCLILTAEDAPAALEALGEHYPQAKRIGWVREGEPAIHRT